MVHRESSRFSAALASAMRQLITVAGRKHAYVTPAGIRNDAGSAQRSKIARNLNAVCV
jgi:hypothetical protein